MAILDSSDQVGVTIDEQNRRVDIRLPAICGDPADVACRVHGLLSFNKKARMFLRRDGTRLSVMMLVPAGNRVDRFVNDGMMVEEEARIANVHGLDVVYLGGNNVNRLDRCKYVRHLRKVNKSICFVRPVPKPFNVTYEQLQNPIADDDLELLREIYQMRSGCCPDVLTNESFHSLASRSILVVARNERDEIIASAVGELWSFGRLTLLKVSEVFSNPEKRVKGAATFCGIKVVEIGRIVVRSNLIAYTESAVYNNLLAVATNVGLNTLAGILPQHNIAQSKNKEGYESVAVLYTAC